MRENRTFSSERGECESISSTRQLYELENSNFREVKHHTKLRDFMLFLGNYTGRICTYLTIEHSKGEQEDYE